MVFDDLRRLFLFDGLSDGDLETLASAGEEVDFHDGEVVFVHGTPADSGGCCSKGASSCSAGPVGRNHS